LPGVAVNEVQCRGAARKGTRERKFKEYQKRLLEKAKWIPTSVSKKSIGAANAVSKRFVISGPAAVDPVYVMAQFRAPSYTFEDAIQVLKATYHWSMGGDPNHVVRALFELDMSIPKKSALAKQRYKSRFSGLVSLSHPFDVGEERTVLAFTKNATQEEEASMAGATLVGGAAIIKQIIAGKFNLNEYDAVVAHPDILPELLAARGLFKSKFPSLKNGGLTSELGPTVLRFKSGLTWSCVPDEFEEDYGLIEVPVGPVQLSEEELRANLKAIVDDVNRHRPSENIPFIRHILLPLMPVEQSHLRVRPGPFTGDSLDLYDQAVEDMKTKEVVLDDEDCRLAEFHGPKVTITESSDPFDPPKRKTWRNTLVTKDFWPEINHWKPDKKYIKVYQKGKRY